MAQATTSILLNALRGKAGSVVFVQTKTGVSVRPRVTPTNPQTPLQMATRQAMQKASTLFSSLDPQTVKLWNSYAQTLKTYDTATGRVKCPSGQNVFAGLCCKLWQMDDTTDVPTTPPAAPFLGDGITVEVTAQAGSITFQASGGNSAGVLTELLVQPLRSGAVTPQKRAYRSAQFRQFTGTHRAASVDSGAGWVAVAVRFVNSDTGQASVLLELGVVQVGDTGGEAPPPASRTPPQSELERGQSPLPDVLRPEVASVLDGQNVLQDLTSTGPSPFLWGGVREAGGGVTPSTRAGPRRKTARARRNPPP